MPCDSSYVTTTMDLAKVPDREILADAMRAAGWYVPPRAKGGDLSAYGGGVTLTVAASGAEVRGNPDNVTRATTAILQAYATQATKSTVSRFGFALQGQETRADGSIAMTFTRKIAPVAGRVKVRI